MFPECHPDKIGGGLFGIISKRGVIGRVSDLRAAAAGDPAPAMGSPKPQKDVLKGDILGILGLVLLALFVLSLPH